MPLVEKISISLDGDAVRWMKKRAIKQNTTLSAVFSEAARLLRQHEARQAVLNDAGGKTRLRPPSNEI